MRALSYSDVVYASSQDCFEQMDCVRMRLRDANATTSIVYGWVSSPGTRGTIDIIQLCLATVVLCTYSALFLHIKHCPTRGDLIIYKTKWVALTIMFPEITCAIAAEQWRSARESVVKISEFRQRLEYRFRTSHDVEVTPCLRTMHRWTAADT